MGQAAGLSNGVKTFERGLPGPSGPRCACKEFIRFIRPGTKSPMYPAIPHIDFGY